MRYILLKMKRFCGYTAGFVFFLSGIVKLLDPVGAGLVMDSYFDFLHIGFLDPASKVLGTLFALAEAVIGTGLITGVWRRVTGTCALIMQIFFTLLTLALFIFNPEMDCGCFGEAIHLTHGQTLIKNLILLGLLLAYTIPYRHLGGNRRRKYVSFSIVTLSVLAFSVYSWISIPLVDFTDFKPGCRLQASADIDAGNMYESFFTYEKDGVQQEFTLGHLPDSSWTFIKTETRLNEGYQESIVVLSFRKADSEEYMDTIAAEGKVMVISIYDTEISDEKWNHISTFAADAEKAGFRALILTSSGQGIPEDLKDQSYISDYKTLVTLNRSNGGATYFCDGELIRKWAAISLPDMTDLHDIFVSDVSEVSVDQDSKGSLGFQGFLLYVFAVMLLL